MKLAWWHDEVERLCAGTPVHPITRYTAALPGAAACDFTPLQRCIEAVAAQVAGVPIERASQLTRHADALCGTPLLTASSMSAAPADRTALAGCVSSLAVGEYLARALLDYRREARAGRMVFAIDELLTAGIDNEDLIADAPSPRLQTYLEGLRKAASRHFIAAGAALSPVDRPALRHLAVLAALGAKRVGRRDEADFRLADLYDAWTAARRAAAVK